ncbi:MAG: 2,4-dihydroxyhept-2-ene-1,7-dioic acid aldolase [Henriciella sp.]|nr:DUF2218 domain-containing protein [Henriciella sp.]MBK75914.1 2,4-dihydroxyhept-2-ene-1,7-dioic acid aldolase [Henriciella sp.]
MQRTALVATENASRYLQQLSKHWAHKSEVEHTATTSRIELPLGELRMQASQTTLGLEISSDTTDGLDKLAGIVEQHLDRFAHRENGLAYEWL